MEKERFFITRHATPERNKSTSDPVSETYPDLTVGGVEQARKKARTDILKMVQDAPEGAVIVIAATSDQPRTKQTAELYGDALAEIQKDTGDEHIIVLTKREIERMASLGSTPEGGGTKGFNRNAIVRGVKGIEAFIKAHADKKVVIDYPLMIKELAYKYHNRWTDSSGKKTEYFSEILKKYNNNHEEAGKDWIASQGHLSLPDGRMLQGPDPKGVAQEYLQGVRRLREFARAYTGDRPLVVGEVGHQWDLDALVTYLGSGGTVDKENFERITGGNIAGETEMARFSIEDGKTELAYRGGAFIFPE